MARRPTELGPVPAPNKPSGDSRQDAEADEEEERTTVDQGPPRQVGSVSPAPGQVDKMWDDRTIVEDEEPTRNGPQPQAAARSDSAPLLNDTVDDEDEPTNNAGDDSHRFADGSGEVGLATMDEPTVEDQARPLPPLSVVPPVPDGPRGKPGVARRPSPELGRLTVVSGNDEGRVYELAGKQLRVGRAVDNEFVLTDIAVSRHHLEIEFDGRGYTLRDRGSGNGTLLNDRVEDGACQLRHGDRIEIGNTVFRFEHPASRGADIGVVGFDHDDDDEVSTIAGKTPRRRASTAKPPLPAPKRPSHPELPLPRRGRRSAPPPTGGRARAATGGSGGRLVLPAQPPGASVPASAEAAAAAARGAAQARSPNALAMPEGYPDAANPVALTMPVQYGAMMPLAGQNRKLIIGLCSAALAIVMISILVLVFREDQPAVASSETTGEGAVEQPVAAGAGDSADETASSRSLLAPIGEGAAAALGDDDEGEETDDGEEIGDGEAGDESSAAAVAASDDESEGEGEGDDEGDEMVVAAADVEPIRKDVPPSTWGTNETFLAATRAARRAAEEPPDEEPAEETDEPPDEETDEPPARVVRKPPRRTANNDARNRNRNRNRARTRPRARTAAAIDNARSRAMRQYKSKQFGAAAATLRSVAGRADGGDAKKLESLASSFEAVGSNLSRGQENERKNPTAAIGAYARALSLDKRHGGGSHAAYIRMKLGAVAPNAAAAYMARKKWEYAKRAADAAVNYGSGGSATVKRVRQALERKAGQFYKHAIKKKSSDPGTAKTYLRRILKMVPPSSPWYAKAYKLLNSRSRSRDDDERFR